MKIKHVITTLALAGMLGAGAFAGIKASGVAKEAKAAAADDYYLVGNINGTEDWDAPTGWKMTQNGKTYKYAGALIKSGDRFGLKNGENGSWQNWWGLDNSDTDEVIKARFTGTDGDPIECTTGGKYDITFNTNDYHILIEAVAHDAISLCGSFSSPSWSPADTNYDFVIAQDGLSASLTTKLNEDDEFKVVLDHGWGGDKGFDDFTLDQSVAGGLVKSGSNAKVAKTGTYTFNVTLDSTTYDIESVNVSAAYSYKVTIGSQEHTLTPNAAGTTYSIEGISVTAGQAITVSLDGTAVSNAKAQKVANNNAYLDNTTYKVLVDNPSANFYYHVSADDFWISGMPEGGFHIIRNGNELIQMAHGEDYEGFIQWYSDSVTFAANDTIRVVNCGAEDLLPVVFDVTTINAAGLGGNFEVKDGKVSCKTACTAQIYLKLKSGADEIYFGSEPEDVALARQFAQAFMDDIVNGACNGGYPVQATLEAAWALKAAAYAAAPMTDDARDELKNNNSVQVIKDFRAAYVYILNLRAAAPFNWTLSNFMNVNLAGTANVTPVANQTANYATPVAVIVISSIAVVSILGVSLMIRRRKEDR